MIIKLSIFIILSLGLIIWSGKLLLNLKVHGFYRFFAFESILALIIINIDNWFANPFSILQIISWILLLSSIIVVVYGIYLLRKIGRPHQGIESTTKLVKTGIYKYIRHPLYSSLILLAWGVFFKNVSWLTLLLTILANICAVATAAIEEKENLQKFGEEYRSYMKSTKRFLPFII
jgi:protein-S-isoprenylcysteine O-methyltransferase Ste14